MNPPEAPEKKMHRQEGSRRLKKAGKRSRRTENGLAYPTANFKNFPEDSPKRAFLPRRAANAKKRIHPNSCVMTRKAPVERKGFPANASESLSMFSSEYSNCLERSFNASTFGETPELPEARFPPNL